ncbi:MAG: prepilin-type N-terminal cleavage/methylation domain-containing protein [bacterium]|nr:prepilin-type N-terminal cleavage/methylation domain-containing protein [bacterium]
MARIYRCEKGLSLIEMMLAVILLLVVALVAAAIFYQGAISTVNTKNAAMAMHVIQGEIEDLRRRGSGDIRTKILQGNDSGTETIEHVPVGANLFGTMTTTVTNIDDPAGGSDKDYLSVEVRVNWSENNLNRERKAITYIYQ